MFELYREQTDISTTSWHERAGKQAIDGRAFVEAAIKDAFLDKAMTQLERYAPGDPLDESTVTGAIVDLVQMQTVLGYIEDGKREGARLLAEGNAVRQANATPHGLATAG